VKSFVVLSMLVATVATVAAQPAEEEEEEVLRPVELEIGRCEQEPPVANDSGIPTTWGEYELVGELVDKPELLRALLDPTMQQSHALTSSARADIRRAARSFGYHLVRLALVEGGKLVVNLAPLPIVRRVKVDVDQSLFDTQFDDEIRRRMRLRIGTYMPSDPEIRKCEIETEQKRLEEYLFEEGYFDATVKITEDHRGATILLDVDADLNDPYQIDVPKIQFVRAPGAPPFRVPVSELRATFVPERTCILFGVACYGTPRFTNAQHKADMKAVAELFQKRGFPAVRVTDDFDPTTLTSIDRSKKTVTFTITIDQRRQLNVVFEGADLTTPETQLQEQLTFNAAGSSDDVEAVESAKAIVEFLQGRGLFDARVTWRRERFPELDTIIYRIEQGGQRRVRDVQFRGNVTIASGVLEDAIATKRFTLTNQLLGTTVRATSSQMAADVERIEALYRRLGYRDVRVRVQAATDPSALDSTALSAAFLQSDRGAGALYVRFTIDEGQPTLLTQVRIELATNSDEIKTKEDRELCDRALSDVADLIGDRHFATPVTSGRCIGIAPNAKYRPAEAEAVKDLLRDRLWNAGRPRTRVEYEVKELGPRRFEAVYKLANTSPLAMGKFIVRGNFKTQPYIIQNELRLLEGAPLTADSLAEAARRLRSTGLFDSVNIDLPDLERTNAGQVHAVIRVEERYDQLMIVDVETGGSTFSGVFAKVSPQFKNLFGYGMSFDLSGTLGFDFFELWDNQNWKIRQQNLEATFRIPGYLTRRLFRQFGTWADVDLLTELTAFTRLQDTVRFGPVTNNGVTLALSKTWTRPRTDDQAQRAVTFGVHYDFRLRERQVDVVRPIGADDDQTQVPIATRTGSVGAAIEYDQRTDRNGYLSPLAPQAGYRFDLQARYASPYLFGQNTFVKISAIGTRYTPLSDNLLLRTDLRYDQGFPLGGASLLPEVERYFAGSDATVRGYADDRLATEIVQVGVPPLANLEQVRILPAGGNIRVMSSIDAQLRIYKVLASAVFIDAGLITNQWETVNVNDIRPSVGMALVRAITPFGAFAFERAIPLRPQLGDDPRGRWHISFAARAQF